MRSKVRLVSVLVLMIVGIAVMVVGLLVSLLGGRFTRDKQVAPFIRLGGVLLCGIGAAMVFI